MPAEAQINKDELLTILRGNMERHRATFERAQEGYRARIIEELDRRLDDARHGRQIDLAFRMPEPEDHTADYEREIRMLELETRSQVRLGMREFDQLVMDRWGWSESFALTSSVYTADHG
jgi:hypothetical protein